jgi:hypothetical protein
MTTKFGAKTGATDAYAKLVPALGACVLLCPVGRVRGCLTPPPPPHTHTNTHTLPSHSHGPRPDLSLVERCPDVAAHCFRGRQCAGRGCCGFVSWAGETWSHATTNRLLLYWEGGVRQARLVKSTSRKPGTAAFNVTVDGTRRGGSGGGASGGVGTGGCGEGGGSVLASAGAGLPGGAASMAAGMTAVASTTDQGGSTVAGSGALAGRADEAHGEVRGGAGTGHRHGTKRPVSDAESFVDAAAGAPPKRQIT